MIAVILTAVATLSLTLVALNFITHEKKIEKQIPRLYGTDDPQFRRTMGVLLGPAIVGGNRLWTLNNGDEIFPAMLAAICAAKRSITFETYIYWSGGIGKTFAEALSERARAGVKVHVLLDWVGSLKMEQALLDEMQRAGVEIAKYHPLHWYHIARMNNRTHRKLLVADGRIGFTGGVGIADKWSGNAQDPDHWRDIHYRVEGPVVAQLQAVFLDNWMKVRGEVLHGDTYFPALEPMGPSPAQMFSSSPSGGGESMRLMYLLSITAARHAIRLSASYFVPDALTIRTLVQARERGVEVQVIVPGGYIDSETVRRASRAKWGALLEAGVEIYEYRPTMFHCKVMVVDEVLVSVGSTNFDNRSFSLNDEANLNVYDIGFAREQVAVFQRDRAHAHRVSLDEWRHRPWQEKLWEHTAALLSSQL
ncbi:MAG: phospholipase D-like domain-containing protein [Burkholderiales bacterium]